MDLEIGLKLRCLNPSGRIIEDVEGKMFGPSCDEIVTIRRFGVFFSKSRAEPNVWFNEYPGDTHEHAFFLTFDDYGLFNDEE